MIVAGAHDPVLVALSVAIAVAASYTALDLAGRVRAASGWSCHAWLGTAAVAMGGGVWSMHFVAMLAHSMPGMEVHYDLGLTALSLLVPIMVTGAGFHFVSRRESGLPTLIFSGLIMGLGIAAMHYTGMAAMRMPAALSHTALWVSLSILIAIGASTVALWLAFKRAGLRRKSAAALVMGTAVAGMHYTAMRAAVFSAHSSTHHEAATSSLGQTALALAVAATTFLILFLALVASMFDRRFAEAAEREADALRRSEEQFRALYRKTPLPLHALDEEGAVREVSDAWLDLLGCEREDVIGRALTSFMSEASAARFVAADRPHLVKTGALRDAECRLVTRGGEALDVLLSVRIERDREGRFVWATGGLVDVTARRKAEEALRQAQKMEAIGQLTGGVAHDFNNLLSVVLGNLGRLRKRMGADESAATTIDNAIEAAQRGAALTQRMLSFARQQSLEPSAIDVPDLVRGMEDLLRGSLGPRVRIDTRFPLWLPKAEADANQLELALLNLAVNSRDAMPEGGTITISAREETWTGGGEIGLAPGRYVCLALDDTGEGMDAATLRRARDPFFTTKPVGKGTGLGLSMVHGFVAQSRGIFVLRSHPGAGTTAEIWLPVAQPAEPEEPTQPQPAAAPAGTISAAVLVVDDDALVRMNTAAMLEDLGHAVHEACDGQQALELLRREPGIALVVTDQAMPGMTGVQLATAIQAQRRDLPILLATGYAEVPEGAGLGLPRLGKPFTMEALEKAVAEALASPRLGDTSRSSPRDCVDQPKEELSATLCARP
jgi:PAS domain S-box-containing protein